MNGYDTNSHVGDTRERDFDREEVEALREQLAEAQEEIEQLRGHRDQLHLALAKADAWVEDINPSPRNETSFRHLSATIKTNLDLSKDALEGGGDDS
jgi:uncharacterized protein (UPF0276 family)